ncbi:MAG TPA: hypothetical protein VF609_08320, partial [Flavisolibacter sp.]
QTEKYLFNVKDFSGANYLHHHKSTHMKKMILSLALLTNFSVGFGQGGPLTKGDIKLNASIGLGSFIKAAGGQTTFPPLTGSLEYAINENTTLGPVIGYTATEDRANYAALGIIDTYTFSNFLIGAKGNHYFNTSESFEAYFGAILGYNAESMKLKSSSARNGTSEYNVAGGSGFFYGIHAGGRYKFSPSLAAHAELGYGIAILNIGLTFSLGKK